MSAVVLVVAAAVPGVRAAAEVTLIAGTGISTPACGVVEFPSSGTGAWVIPGGGVDVFSNGPAKEGTGSDCAKPLSKVGGVVAGEEWQCVEFVNRLYLTRGWITGPQGGSTPAWPGDAGPAFYDQAPSNLVKQPDGSVSYLGPGDVVIINVFKYGSPDGGHALVVNDTSDVTSGTVHLVSQNSGYQGNSEPVVTGKISGGSVTVGGGSKEWTYTTIGVVHAPTWGQAVEVPGTAAPNKGGDAEVASVSCASAGNCSAGGFYTDGSGYGQAFVVTETGGIWGSAKEARGTAALNKGGEAYIESVSCARAGSCSAVGDYAPGSGHAQAFVVTETGGIWGEARGVPGTAALDQGGETYIFSVSCASAGNCSAGGGYESSSRGDQAFVVAETRGTWGEAREVPGTAALNKGGGATVYEVSCASAGNCSAGGYYQDASTNVQAFVVTETGGTWGKAREVPGTAVLNKGGDATVYEVSCASAGNCSAGGFYTDGSGHGQAFVVTETGGIWGSAQEVPGMAALNKGGDAYIVSVSCASAGACSAGGRYEDGTHHAQAFVVTETGGIWGSAQEVPGTAALNKGGDAYIVSVSCASAGACTAGGSYENGSGRSQAFVVNEG